MIKRVFIFILSATLLTSILNCTVFALMEPEVIISVSSVRVNKADSATVFISFDKNSGVAAGDIAIRSKLKIKSITANGIQAYSSTLTGRINWSYTKNIYLTGDVFEVIFELPENIDSDSEWSVDVYVNDLIDEKLNRVSYKVNSGAVVCSTGNKSFIKRLVELIKNFFRRFFSLLLKGEKS